MFGLNEKTLPVVKTEIHIASFGTKCEIQINKKFFEQLSKEQQNKVTNIIQNSFQEITEILEEKKA